MFTWCFDREPVGITTLAQTKANGKYIGLLLLNMHFVVKKRGRLSLLI